MFQYFLLLQVDIVFTQVANMIRFLVDSYNKPVPAILEIPSKDHPYDPTHDSVLSRVKYLFNTESVAGDRRWIELTFIQHQALCVTIHVFWIQIIATIKYHLLCIGSGWKDRTWLIKLVSRWQVSGTYWSELFIDLCFAVFIYLKCVV